MKEFSTTNARVIVTIVSTLGTAVKYWATGDVPATEWLIFLAAMNGIDVTAVIGKRKTADPDVIRAEAEAAARKVKAAADATPPLSSKQATDIVGEEAP